MKTTLRNLRDVSEDDGFEEGMYSKLVEIEDTDQLVTVDCEACDGFYDVTLPDGTEVAALSWYHLTGFDSPY